MLGKLIKHEFRATAKTMGLLFIIVFGGILLAALSVALLSSTRSGVLMLLCSLILFAAWVAVMASFIMPAVIMIKRFHRSLLSDEGYLTLTLPVSIHQILFSKLIVSAVWFIATAVVDILALLAVTFTVGGFTGEFTMGDFFRGFNGMFDFLTVQYALNGVAYILEFAVMVFLACFATCLLFYAAMATGYGFSRHKGWLSVAFYFIYSFAASFIGIAPLVGWGLGMSGSGYSAPATEISMLAQVHAVFWIIIVVEAVYCAVFYLITWLNLKKRLNLE